MSQTKAKPDFMSSQDYRLGDSSGMELTPNSSKATPVNGQSMPESHAAPSTSRVKITTTKSFFNGQMIFPADHKGSTESGNRTEITGSAKEYEINESGSDFGTYIRAGRETNVRHGDTRKL